MKGIGAKVATGLLVVAFLFFGLKSCVVTIWTAPLEPETYAVHGGDGRTLAMVFLPKNETILLYMEKHPPFMEAVLTKMLGSYGTHYFWRLWSVDGPSGSSGLLGYRIYPEGVRPVVMETTVLKKFIHGSSKPTLRSEGDRTHPVILFADNAVRFEDMWLEKEPTDTELVQALLKQLRADE